ncbi:MAG: LptF/LptG family permease [Candidatus Omnitrophica bacterium]|nr:LptF/LptG family permease [Candidatus Omnitrophota bacterium]
MRILDRYISNFFLKMFFLCVSVFLFLFIIVDLFSHLELILENKLGWAILKHYYISLLPTVFIQVSPFACLLATLYTFAKMNNDNEITAMRASGLSVFDITRTTIIFGFILTIFVFWLNDRVAPAFRYKNSIIKETMENAKPNKESLQEEILNNLAVYGRQNRLFYIKKFNLSNNQMFDIIILEHDNNQNIVKKIVATKGIYNDNVWKFFQCITYQYSEDGQLKESPKYSEEEIVPFPETPQDFILQRQNPSFMNVAQLEDYIWRLSKSGATAAARNFQVDYYDRFTMPLANLIIILLGIPFALRIRKKAPGLSAFGVSLILGFFYYILSAICLALGKAGIISPIFATTASHSIMLIISLYLLSTLP